MNHNFNPREIDRIIEMAWEDRTTFDAIKFQFGLKNKKSFSWCETAWKDRVLIFGENVFLVVKLSMKKSVILQKDALNAHANEALAIIKSQNVKASHNFSLYLYQ